jgi:hypothetical protein
MVGGGAWGLSAWGQRARPLVTASTGWCCSGMGEAAQKEDSRG